MTRRLARKMAIGLRAFAASRRRGLPPALWPLAQTAVAAGVAWEIARRGLGHGQPVFASITAVVAMGFRAGRRAQQAAVLALGTAVGIGIADLLLRRLSPGGPAIALAVFLTMVIALALSREPGFVSQVGISALLLVTVEHGKGVTLHRMEDGLVGSGVAIVVSLILFPIDPVSSIRRHAGPILSALAATLEDSAVALRENRLDKAAQARGRRVDQRELMETVAVALTATRIAPRRWRDRSRVLAEAAAVKHLDALVRGIRVVAGTTHRIVREGRAPDPELAEPIAALASALRALDAWLEEGRDELRQDTRARAARAAALAAAVTPSEALGAATVTHLVQALAVDVLRATGARSADIQRLVAAGL